MSVRMEDFYNLWEIDLVHCRAKKFADLALGELPFVAPITPVSGTPSGAKGIDGWPENEMPRKI